MVYEVLGISTPDKEEAADNLTAELMDIVGGAEALKG